ncbi:MAG: glutamine-hydrolyzing GMP synthase [Candidatus Edwardsbacteria bacterium]
MQRYETILILDFGSQYTQLIARKIRECRVYCEIVPFDISIGEIIKRKPKGLIFSGGPAGVYEEKAPHCDKEIFRLGLPILGICYGMQLMTHLLGGKVEKSQHREYGRTTLIVDKKRPLFLNLKSKKLLVWMSHGDKVVKLPPKFVHLAHTSNSPFAAMMDEEGKFFGVQFHPEVAHTQRGKEIIKNFLFNVCNCSGNWTMESFIQSSIKKIRQRVRNRRVICGLSGGVDSSVTALLVHRAIGNKLSCIFVDNGLLRVNEKEEVIKTFCENFHLNLHLVDAQERFLKRLKGVIDPEEKRKIIGEEFIKVFTEEASRIGKTDFLAQGTLYPDVIESVSYKGPSAKIKSHHNVGGLPEVMPLSLIEPLRELFKDEVRLLARKLGLPEEIIWRQPFPGPGLAVRILGEATKERLNILRQADFIVLEEIRKAKFYHRLWQFFAVLLPVKTVGIMGDERTYENVIALRAVTSEDGMTADWAKLPHKILGNISNRIINEVKGVNRVVFDISSKPPSTIEWE